MKLVKSELQGFAAEGSELGSDFIDDERGFCVLSRFFDACSVFLDFD